MGQPVSAPSADVGCREELAQHEAKAQRKLAASQRELAIAQACLQTLDAQHSATFRDLQLSQRSCDEAKGRATSLAHGLQQLTAAVRTTTRSASELSRGSSPEGPRTPDPVDEPRSFSRSCNGSACWEACAGIASTSITCCPQRCSHW